MGTLPGMLPGESINPDGSIKPPDWYFTDTGQRQDYSAQALEALHRGDLNAYQAAIEQFKQMSGGAVPIWAPYINPADVTNNAVLPGGIGAQAAYQQLQDAGLQMPTNSTLSPYLTSSVAGGGGAGSPPAGTPGTGNNIPVNSPRAGDVYHQGNIDEGAGLQGPNVGGQQGNWHGQATANPFQPTTGQASGSLVSPFSQAAGGGLGGGLGSQFTGFGGGAASPFSPTSGFSPFGALDAGYGGPDSWMGGLARSGLGGLQNYAAGQPGLFGQQLANYGGQGQLQGIANGGLTGPGANALGGWLGGTSGLQSMAGGNFGPYGSGLQGYGNNQALQRYAAGQFTDPASQMLLSNQLGNNQYLNSIAQNQGNPIDQLPAWDAMRAAQQRNIDEGAAQLAEQFNVSGNRFSTTFGTAAADYMNQAKLNQNALLGQMTANALDSAQGRYLGAAQQLGQQQYGAASQLAQMPYGAAQALGQYGYGGLSQLLGQQYGAAGQLAGLAGQSAQALAGQQFGGAQTLANLGLPGLQQLAQQQYGAAGQLGQMGFQGASQLSAQDFSSQMQQYQLAAQLAQQLASGSDAAAGQLANLGAGASNTILQNAMQGAQALFGGENQGALGMYAGQNQTLPYFMQNDLAAQQLGLGTASGLSNLWNQNLMTGSQLGGQQYGLQQDALNRMYQEWMRTQPAYNPLLQMMYSAATYYPSPVFPSYIPGMFGQMMGGLGGLLGGIGSLY